MIQTSAMDCGPASLKCLLEGFGVPVSYGRLREACQTQVDGTSIDTLEEIAIQLGLDAEQIILPEDHLLLGESEALPAIVVTRLPNGDTHFVVVWSTVGPLVQVMDPGMGRRWRARAQFLRELYHHRMPVPAAGYREWAGQPGFAKQLARRTRSLGIAPGESARLLAEALRDPGWRGVGALDAAIRMVATLHRSGGVAGADAARLIETLVRDGRERIEAIPEAFWSVRPHAPAAGSEAGWDAAAEEQVELRGCVLIRVAGMRVPADDDEQNAARGPAPLPAELTAALAEPPRRPLRELLALLRDDGAFAPTALVAALAIATFGTVLEAVLFRGLFDLGRSLTLRPQRLAASAALLGFLAILLALELPLERGLQRLGRGLEARLRLAFLAKIPRLPLRYFQSRPASDMTSRSHNVHVVRQIPALCAQALRALFGLCATTAGILWIDPSGARLALAASALALAVPLALQKPLIERDLRFRTHGGSLARFYLDALQGLVPIRTHAAERAVRREHEGLLVEWYRTGRDLLRLTMVISAISALTGLGFSAWLLVDYLASSVDQRGVLLVVYWALQLPILGERLAVALRQYPSYRNITLRLLEPLGAPEEGELSTGEVAQAAPPAALDPAPPGVAIAFSGVSVRAGGHTILDEVDLSIAAGEHLAIVGTSGAGKSSLVGLLLGWHRASTGRITVDGRNFDGRELATLRGRTAWVDPAVQLWNRSLLENLYYGSRWDAQAPLARILDGADLRGLLDRLPIGLQTSLGESGGLVSGGEGQRVRLGRALLREDARLVVLDEPFRGLDREKRRALLERARRHFARATLICVTHDLDETRAFPRVLVLEGGRIVEDAPPDELIAREDSRYGALLRAETELRTGLWTSSVFRRLRVEGGRVTEAPRTP